MKEYRKSGIRTRSCSISAFAAGRLILFFFAAMWILLLASLLLIPLVRALPWIKSLAWIVLVPSCLLFAVWMPLTLTCFGTVILKPGEVILKWCGIPFKRIPASDLRLFCAVGSASGNALCLSLRTAEELAGMQEVRLLKGFLSRHDVPVRKQNPGWMDAFSREYLHFLLQKPSTFLGKQAVMLDMNPALQYLIHRMYPQLPYRNYTEIASGFSSPYMQPYESRAVCFTPYLTPYSIRMDTDGIRISTRKKELFRIPAQDIKTAVRIDFFMNYQKYFPAHTPMMFISCQSEAELAAQAPRKIFGCDLRNTPDTQLLLAMISARRKAWLWNKKQQDSCIMLCSEGNLQKLRTLYPDVHINDLSAGWLRNAEITKQD